MTSLALIASIAFLASAIAAFRLRRQLEDVRNTLEIRDQEVAMFVNRINSDRQRYQQKTSFRRRQARRTANPGESLDLRAVPAA